jgi:hypothetical protein
MKIFIILSIFLKSSKMSALKNPVMFSIFLYSSGISALKILSYLVGFSLLTKYPLRKFCHIFHLVRF